MFVVEKTIRKKFNNVDNKATFKPDFFSIYVTLNSAKPDFFGRLQLSKFAAGYIHVVGLSLRLTGLSKSTVHKLSTVNIIAYCIFISVHTDSADHRN